jgi:hypothetical protein
MLRAPRNLWESPERELSLESFSYGARNTL